MARAKMAAVIAVFVSFSALVAFAEKTAWSGEKRNGLREIIGMVVDTSGRPVSQLAVMVRTSDYKQVGIIFTDRNGMFRFYNLPPGFYEFSLPAAGHNSVPKILHYTGKVPQVNIGVMEFVFRFRGYERIPWGPPTP